MLWLILIVGGLLIMMGQHDRSEALFYYFRLEDQVPETHLLRLIVRPIRVHHFLLTHSGHQEEFAPEFFFLVACWEEFAEVFLLVDLRFLLCEARPIVLPDQATNPLCLQEGLNVCELVPAGTRSLFLFVA